MDSTLLAAIATGVATVATVIINTVVSNHKMMAVMEKQQAVFEAHVSEKIDRLTERQDKHNKVIERTYALEQQVARHDERIRALEEE